MNKKTQLLLITTPLLLTLIGVAYTGAQLNIPDVTNHRVVEGVITEINPEEYHSFKVTYYIEGELAETWCTPSTFFTTLYQDGLVEVDETLALALIDPDTNMGIVFDSIPNQPETVTPEEPEENVTEPETPVEEETPVEDETPEEEVPPEEEPEVPVEEEPEETEPEVEPEAEPEVALPEGLELVSSNAEPNPDLVAPEGKVKLTIMAQPAALPGVTVYPPPGVYYADEGLKLLFTCTVEIDNYEFAYWNIGLGADGSIRKTGVGYEHYVRITLDQDMVVTAYLKKWI